MARPRKSIRYIQTGDGLKLVEYPHGTEVPGLSVNQSTGMFYSIRSDGSRQYWGRDLGRAIRSFKSTTEGTPPRLVKPDAEAVLAIQVDDRWAERNVDKSNLARMHVDHLRQRKGLPAIYGPPYPLIETAPKASPAKAPGAPTGNRLRDVWSVLEDIKSATVKAETLSDYKTAWNRFVDAVGNKRVNDLTADDFAAWRRWVARHLDGKSGSYINHTHTTVQTIIREVRRDRPSWGWPAGLTDWMSDRRPVRHRPDKRHRQMMPVDAYDALCQTADDWKRVNPETIPATSQRNLRLRQLARMKRRQGYQMAVAVRVCCNAGLGIVDLTELRWENLKLDGRVPYLDLPRGKTAKQVGGETPRLIPLLPSTIQALRDLRAYEANPSPFVLSLGIGGEFGDGAGYSERGIKKQIGDLLRDARANSDAVNGWTWKHLRNVGGSLAKRAKLSNDERSAFLGHVDRGTNRFYEDDVDETYLVRLINLIGRSHFEGERLSVQTQGVALTERACPSIQDSVASAEGAEEGSVQDASA